jgi:hypothetical protein
MIFLNSVLLAFLGALSIPFLLHLFNPFQQRITDISTIRFLKKIESSRTRWVKIRRLLLLLVRTLLLLLIVFSFARPVIQGALSSSTAPRRLFILLDNSFSTSFQGRIQDGGAEFAGTAFENIKQQVTTFVGSLSSKDRIYLVNLAPSADDYPGYLDQSEALAFLDLCEASWSADNLSKALKLTENAIADLSSINMELHLFTDLRLQPENIHKVDLPAEASFHLHLINNEIVNNAVCENVSLLTSIFKSGESVDMSAHILSAGRTSGLSVDLELGENRLGRFELPPAESLAEFRFSLPSIGRIPGKISLHGDAVSHDNDFLFVVDVSGQMNILLVADDYQLGRKLAKALKPDARYEEEFSLEQCSIAEIAAYKIDDFDCVLLCPGSNSLDKAGDVLKRATRDGTGIFIVPAADVNLDELNHLFKKLELPEVLQIDDSGNRFSREYDLDHPLFVRMLEKESAGEEISFSSILSSEQGGRTLISAGRNSPLLTEHKVEASRVFILHSSPDAGWSSLGSAGLLAPLISRGCRYLGDAASDISGGICGLEYSIPFTAKGNGVLKLSGAGVDQLIQPASSKSSLVLPVIHKPGYYKISDTETELGLIAVNADSRESITRQLDLTTLSDLSGVNWQQSNAGSSSQRADLDLAWILLLFALILLVFESLLSTGGKP